MQLIDNLIQRTAGIIKSVRLELDRHLNVSSMPLLFGTGLKARLTQPFILPYQGQGVPRQINQRLINEFESKSGKQVKVELFARTKKDGWLSWGNEIDSDFEIEEVE